jgi:hypothetical protein
MGHFHRRNPNHQLVTIDNILEEPIIVTNNSYQYIDNITRCFNPSPFFSWNKTVGSFPYFSHLPTDHWNFPAAHRRHHTLSPIPRAPWTPWSRNARWECDRQASGPGVLFDKEQGFHGDEFISFFFVQNHVWSNSVTIHKACWE